MEGCEQHVMSCMCYKGWISSDYNDLRRYTWSTGEKILELSFSANFTKVTWTNHLISYLSILSSLKEKLCCSVAKLCLTLCDPMDCSTPDFPVLHYLPEFAQIHVHWCQWCHPTVSSSVAPFSSCPQSLPPSGSFPVSQHFVLGGQIIGASALDLPMNIHDWFPLGLTGFISFLSKRLSRVFSNTTIQKHQFFSTQPCLWSNSRIHTWLREEP